MDGTESLGRTRVFQAGIWGPSWPTGVVVLRLSVPKADPEGTSGT